MKTSHDAGERRAGGTRFDFRYGTHWGWCFAAVLGMGIGFLGALPLASRAGISSPLLALENTTLASAEDGSYSFFPFRRNLWVVHHEPGTVQFFMFPSTEEKPVQPSRSYNVNRTEFPSEQVVYLVSDVNLTSHLWILNPITGKARYLRALRDGTLDVSKLLEVDKQG